MQKKDIYVFWNIAKSYYNYQLWITQNIDSNSEYAKTIN